MALTILVDDGFLKALCNDPPRSSFAVVDRDEEEEEDGGARDEEEEEEEEDAEMVNAGIV